MQHEALLIQKLKEGDRKAFKELYDDNVNPLYRFMTQFSHDKYQVDEWVQRAFIKSYEKIGKFDGISKYSTWLFKIAINEMKMDMRRSNNHPNIILEDERLPEDEMADYNFEWDQLMKNWLNELDETKRMVFILFEVEGYSHAEIASMLSIKESASRTILTRTKRWLQLKWNETENIK